MEVLTKILYLVVMFSPLLMLIAAAIVYWGFRIASDTKQRRSIFLFVAGIVAFGGFIGWLGMVIGISIFCSKNSGAQCGFGGVFFTGPLAFSVTVVIYLWLWAKGGRRTKGDAAPAS